MLGSRPRRLVFGALTFALVALAVEALGVFSYLIQRGEWFSYSRIHAAQRDIADPPDATVERQPADWSRALAVHPYFGFAVDPESEAVQHDLPAGLKNDPYGFQTASPPLQ